MAKSSPYSMDLAEYAEYLHEVNATLGINLRESMNEYLNTKLLPAVIKHTPESDGLGKDGFVEERRRRTSKENLSGLAVHAKKRWFGSVDTIGNTVVVSISNDAPYAEFLEYGSAPRQDPWPNPSDYPEPRTTKKADPNVNKVHGSRKHRIWAGGRNPGFKESVGGPVALALNDYTGRTGFANRAKGYTVNTAVATMINEVRTALTRERQEREKKARARNGL